MKKFITLLFAVGAVTSVFAQSDREEARRIVLGSGSKNGGTTTQDGKNVVLGNGGNVYGDNGTRYPNGSYPSGTRAARIDQVNREYDAKIYSVRNNRNLSSAEKDRIIRQLEADRQRAIRRINNEYDGQNRDGRRYEGRDRRHDDDDDDNQGRNYKGNNGKHLGWEKGVGNPHRSGNNNYKGKSHGNGKGKKG